MDTILVIGRILVALAPLPTFLLGYATYKRSRTSIPQDQDSDDFGYRFDRNTFERKSGIAVMVMGIIIWACIILYYLIR